LCCFSYSNLPNTRYVKRERDLYRGINEFKGGYHPRNRLVKDENGDLADSQNILNGWTDYFSQLFNVRNVSDAMKIEIHTAEQLVHGLSCLEVEIAILELKKYKSPCNDKILAELIQVGIETLVSAVLRLMNSFGIRKNCLISGLSLLIYQFTKGMIKLIAIIILGYHCY
jgi:hypothetical protein